MKHFSRRLFDKNDSRVLDFMATELNFYVLGQITLQHFILQKL